MSTHVDIDLSTLEYNKLSDPFELFTFNLNEEPNGSLPSYLDQSLTLSTTAIDAGHVTTVVYWFDLWLTPKVLVRTVDTKLHWRQAAVMQKNRIGVSTGTPLVIQARCKSSCIDISVSLK